MGVLLIQIVVGFLCLYCIKPRYNTHLNVDSESRNTLLWPCYSDSILILKCSDCAPSAQNCPKGPPGPDGEKGEPGSKREF